MRFYTAEVILGLEHMHRRCVVYQDLKVRVASVRGVLRAPVYTHRGPVGVRGATDGPHSVGAWTSVSQGPRLWGGDPEASDVDDVGDVVAR
jgi:hypothetical protein